MAPDSSKDQIKDIIESEEMILKTKILEARSDFAKKVKKAQLEADKDYQIRLKEIEKKRKDQFSQIDALFKEFMTELEKTEEVTFLEIEKKYEQREKEVIDKLLKYLIP